jgi:predicted kinase
MQQPTLFLLVGYPGSGKTTTSKIIHKFTGAEHLWADRERNAMFPSPTHNHEENIQLYAALNQKTKKLLEAGTSVIFDTNFNFYKDRKRLRAMAAKAGARSVVVWLVTSKELARERATAHALDGEHGHNRVWGNMTVDQFERIAGNLQAPNESERPIKLDGTNLTEAMVVDALQPYL